MIRLQRNRSAIPASFKAQKLRDKALKLIDLYYGRAADGSLNFKKASLWGPAKTQLKKETLGKCAYCEATAETVAHGDVEHFRPKSIYWWLAYCYDNYLYSCQVCNQIHKGDRFLLAPGPAGLQAPAMPAARPAGGAELDNLITALTLDALALQDNDLITLWAPEVSDLVNPYFEDPAPLFRYEHDADNQWVWVRAGAGPRAQRALQASETFLGINRPELRRARGAIFTQIAVAKAIWDAGDANVRPLVTHLIQEYQRANQPFAGMARWFAAEWGLPPPPP